MGPIVTAMTASPGSSSSGSASSGDDGPPPVAELSYEQARTELAGIVAALESGGAELAESLALWERGEELAAHCERWLQQAQQRLTEVQAAEQPEPGQR